MERGHGDLVNYSLSQSIDWERLEAIVFEVLRADDLPNIRKLGGTGDGGADSVETSTYLSNGATHTTVVQITSQQAQLDKAKKTIKRLKESNTKFESLVFVYRDAVETTTRTDIIRLGVDNGVAIDVRDRFYLVARLGGPSKSVYTRYFSDIKKQVGELLGTADPLETVSDRLRHAMLATIGAFVLSREGRLARQTLFEQTLLAVAVSLDPPRNRERIRQALAELLPHDEIADERIEAAVEALKKCGSCTERLGEVEPTDSTLAQIRTAMGAIRDGYSAFISDCISSLRTNENITQADAGHAERNIRKCLLNAFRIIGPLELAAVDPVAIWSDRDVLRTLGADLPPKVASSLSAVMAEQIKQPLQRKRLAPLGRAYAAIAIRNLDPLGRRWQKVVVGRSVYCLDADAVLFLLIKELPESRALTRAVQAMVADGAQVVVPPAVLDEVAGHISRADTTYRRFSDRLGQMSPEMVDADVWHALVRGYCHARLNNEPTTFSEYWDRYYDRNDPVGFVEFMLDKVCKFKPLAGGLTDDDKVALEAISGAILNEKEVVRQKASFRDEEQMERRVRADCEVALLMAQRTDDPGKPEGYIVSQDSAFRRMEQQGAWGRRPRVSLYTSALPQIAEFVCGGQMDDDEVVALLFDPIVAAAIEGMGKDIETLLEVGADLRSMDLSKLEFKLRGSLRSSIHDFGALDSSADNKLVVSAALKVASDAKRQGIPLIGPMDKVVQHFESNATELEALKEENAEIRKALGTVAQVAAGTTKSARRRIRAALEELGINLEAVGENGQLPPTSNK